MCSFTSSWQSCNVNVLMAGCWGGVGGHGGHGGGGHAWPGELLVWRGIVGEEVNWPVPPAKAMFLSFSASSHRNRSGRTRGTATGPAGAGRPAASGQPRREGATGSVPRISATAFSQGGRVKDTFAGARDSMNMTGNIVGWRGGGIVLPEEPGAEMKLLEVKGANLGRLTTLLPLFRTMSSTGQRRACLRLRTVRTSRRGGFPVVVVGDPLSQQPKSQTCKLSRGPTGSEGPRTCTYLRSLSGHPNHTKPKGKIKGREQRSALMSTTVGQSLRLFRRTSDVSGFYSQQERSEPWFSTPPPPRGGPGAGLAAPSASHKPQRCPRVRACVLTSA